jgi:hypothetical protein
VSIVRAEPQPATPGFPVIRSGEEQPAVRPTPPSPKSSLTINVTDRHSQADADRAARRAQTPEERLDEVEALRLQAGKFLYEYPTRLRRLLTVARGSSR